MQVNSINNTISTSFNGKFSAKTLAKFKENLTPEQYKIVKNFRTGKKYTNIDIMTTNNGPVRMPNGSVIMPKETYAVITNSKKKNGIQGRIKLADGVLPFNMDTLKVITADIVQRGEKIIEIFK